MRSLDDVFALLSRQRRRYALYYLEDRDEAVSIEELAGQIREWERDSSSAPDVSGAEEVVLMLEHDHLPKIDEAEFIHYDRDENEIEITGSTSEFSVILSVARAIEKPSRENDIVRITSED